MNEFGNISIKGCLPELIFEKEYKIEVEFEEKSKYKTYNVIKILNNLKPANESDAMIYLSKISTPTRAKNILAVYPDFLDRITNGKEVLSSKIKGVGEKTLASLIEKVKLQYTYYDLIVEYEKYDLTMSQLKKIQNKYGTVEKIRLEMQRNPYACLCSVGGIGFKTADSKILNDNEKFRKSPFRMTECILYCLSQNEIDGNTYMLINDLYNQARELVPESIMYFNGAIEKSERIFLHSDRQRVSKTNTYLCEEEVAKRLVSLQSEKTKWKDSSGREISSNDVQNKYKQIGNIRLTEEQQKTIPLLIDNNVVVLAGFAGAGKSSSCKAVISWLEDNYKSYVLLAPTGRAASVLSSYTERQAMTIHRALEAKGENHFGRNEDNKLVVDVVIVDEATMADVFLFRALLRALPEWSKILFVCDPAQIPSVGAGNVIQDMIRSKEFPVIMLDEIFRYGEGGLSYVATQTRKGKNYLSKENYQTFGVNEDYVFEETDGLDKAIKTYTDLINSGVSVNDVVVISCFNKGELGTYKINNMIQQIINPPKQKNDNKVGCTKDKVDIRFNVGDRVMMTKNNYSVDLAYEDEKCILYNGDFGIVKEITDDLELICDFGTNVVCLQRKDIKNLLLGYSVSCHKMQGDNRQYIILVTPKAHSYMLNRNLLYVALTRSKKKTYHYGSRETIRKCLYKSENLSRKTFMEELLRQCDGIVGLDVME